MRSLSSEISVQQLLHFSYLLCPNHFPEIDNEGVVETDNDEPQPVGDMNAEVRTCN